MMIEVTGGHAANKGAQLMLLTVIRELGRFDASLEFCCPPHGPYRPRAEYGLWHSFPKRRLKGAWATRLELSVNRVIGFCTRDSTCQRYGLARPQDTDALVDISGSLFSQVWPVSMMRGLAELIADYHRRGKPAVLLPQMFGPFDAPGAAETMRRVIRNVDLAYARDAVSFELLRRCVGDEAKVRRAPDITIFTEPLPPERADDRPYACVVPNARVIDFGASHSSDAYLSLLEQTTRRLLSRGLIVKIALHDFKGRDQALAEELRQRCGSPELELVAEADPLRLKRIIAGSRLVVASRYHSVVAALSSGTPPITIGWAHKYSELLSDFGVPQLLQRAEDPPQRVLDMIDQLLVPTEREAVGRTLREAKSRMAPVARRMWEDVAAVLKLPSGTAAAREEG